MLPLDVILVPIEIRRDFRPSRVPSIRPSEVALLRDRHRAGHFDAGLGVQGGAEDVLSIP
jgi:hypothetical protein